jgi:hypothetical protein
MEDSTAIEELAPIESYSIAFTIRNYRGFATL